MPVASQNLRKTIEELMSLTYKAITDFSKCKSCGKCIQFCPLKIRIFNSDGIAITIETNNSCGGCSVCYKRCPQKAIRLIPVQRLKKKNDEVK